MRNFLEELWCCQAYLLFKRANPDFTVELMNWIVKEGAEGYSNQSLRLSKQEEYTWIVSGCVQLASFTFKQALFAHLEC